MSVNRIVSVNNVELHVFEANTNHFPGIQHKIMRNVYRDAAHKECLAMVFEHYNGKFECDLFSWGDRNIGGPICNSFEECLEVIAEFHRI